MESLDRLRRQLDGFEDLQSVVRTMKTLAAVNIHHYEQAVRALAVWYRTVGLGLHVVLRDLNLAMPQAAGAPGEGAAFVVFGSDHGLCGRFNEELGDQTIAAIASARQAAAAGGRRQQGGEAGKGGNAGQAVKASAMPARVLAVGARVAQRLLHAGVAVEETLEAPGSVSGITDCVRQVLMRVDAWRDAGIASVDLVYGRHLSSASSQPTTARLLPVDFAAFAALEAEPWASRSIPTYTMARDELLAALLRQYFFVSVFRASAESLASETGARLVAMQAAEKNLAERQGEIGAAFRRARQDRITAELLELGAGYELASEERSV